MDVEHIKKRIEDGYTRPQIANEYNVKTYVLSNFMKKHDIQKRRKIKTKPVSKSSMSPILDTNTVSVDVLINMLKRNDP